MSGEIRALWEKREASLWKLHENRNQEDMASSPDSSISYYDFGDIT